MKRLNGLDMVSLILVIVGAINWGLIGLFRYNLIDSIFGPMSALSRIIYTLVGLSGIYLAFGASRFTRAPRSPEDNSRVHTGSRPQAV